MEDWQVILLILVLVAFIYLIFFFFDVSHAFEFRSRLHQRLKALSTVCTEKQRLLRLVYTEMEKHEMTIRQSDKDAISNGLAVNCADFKFDNAKEELAKLNAASSHIIYVVQSNAELEKDQSIAKLLGSLTQNERFIRQSTTAYNMDVVALNYWISMPLVGWTTYIFGLRKQKPIV